MTFLIENHTFYCLAIILSCKCEKWIENRDSVVFRVYKTCNGVSNRKAFLLLPTISTRPLTDTKGDRWIENRDSVVFSVYRTYNDVSDRKPHILLLSSNTFL